MEITLGNTVTTISGGAFSYCSNLKDVFFPQSVNSIGENIFLMGTSATRLHVYQNSYAYSFFKDSGFKIVFITAGSSGSISWNLSDDGVLTFSGEGMLTSNLANQAEKEQVISVVIQEGITGITGTAFYNFPTLMYITLPESITDIGSAFLGGNINKTFFCKFHFGSELCTVLSSRGTVVSSYYPSLKVKQIQNEDLSLSLSIEGLTEQYPSVTIPAALDGIPVSSIKSILNNHSVKNIVIEANVETLSDSAFQNCSSLTNVILPVTLTSIPEKAFYMCSSLESVEIPASVQSIGDNAFDGCSHLSKIDIPYGVKSIPQYALRNCTSLQQVTVPNTVTSIGPYAFYNCSSLQQINLPSNIISFGSSALDNCTSLKKVVFSPKSLTAQTLSQSGFFTTYVGSVLEGSVKNGDDYYPISELFPNSMSEDPNMQMFERTTDGQLIAVQSGYYSLTRTINNNVVLKLFITVMDISGVLSLPEELTVIEEEAFSYTPAQKVIIHNKCNTICKKAFSNGQIIIAEIPDSVKTIEENAFYNCPIIQVSTNSADSYVTDWCDSHGIDWYVN